ncbi:quinolinate synthase NadA [Spirochaetota bacterium]
MDIKKEIKELAKKKNAIILAHNYQPGEIQDIADVTGDSLDLARKAADNDADIIVFCGVHFMAESAAILSPQKKVLLPEPKAGCPMADMVAAEDLEDFKISYPNAKVVTYINSTAEVKALSDVICTSTNAKTIVDRIDAEQIIFTPDRNLGHYIQRFTDKEIILWQGFCPTHENFFKEDLVEIKKKHPDAVVMVHPECQPSVIDMADEVLSTGNMVKFVMETDAKKVIVGTEIGMIHKLKLANDKIEYIPASDSFICPNMKKITMEKLYQSILNEKTHITVNKDISIKAKKALDKMLELSY